GTPRARFLRAVFVRGVGARVARAVELCCGQRLSRRFGAAPVRARAPGARDQLGALGWERDGPTRCRGTSPSRHLHPTPAAGGLRRARSPDDATYGPSERHATRVVDDRPQSHTIRSTTIPHAVPARTADRK